MSLTTQKIAGAILIDVDTMDDYQKLIFKNKV